MKTKSIIPIAALLLSAFSLQPSTSLAQGSLTPPGAPAPTMKTLAQIEPRTPIASAPFNISAPGSYYLTTNLTVSGGNAIVILTNGVTLDLGGFTLKSTAASSGGYGILINGINGGLRNLTILNGFIEGGVTNNGSGGVSGPGFSYGVYYYVGQPANTRVSGVSVVGCLSDGINLGNMDTTVVESCTVRTVGGFGIDASTIKACVAMDCSSIAIWGGQVSDCRGESILSYGVYAITAQNCSGTSSRGYGLFATTAQNCSGFTSSGNYGLYATTSAQNCYGASTSGIGLYAYNASFCTGNRPSGTAIQATIATGCIATAGTNLITYKYNMP